MFPVSDAYKQAMKENNQKYKLFGTVAGVDFDDSNILKGSFNITNQCSGNDEVLIGQVYIGELNATLRGLDIDRYSLRGKKIIPEFGMNISHSQHEEKYEVIPLGVYNISEANYTRSGIVIKAYDNMSKFDVDFDGTILTGTPEALYQYACDFCGVECGTGSNEFDTFANANRSLTVYEENDIETWRDFISWLAQACGCYATCDRLGRLVFRQYNQSVVDTIDAKHRLTGGSFSGYVTKYTGMYVDNKDTNGKIYYSINPDDGLTYDIGANPFLQYGIEDTTYNMRMAVLRAMQSIEYVPFEMEMIGNPAYDLGDVFCFKDGIADENKLCCMTKYTFNYNGKFHMEGVGKDPALNGARSKTDKAVAGLASKTDENQIYWVVWTNTKDISIADGQDKEIMQVHFAVKKSSHVAIDMEILLTSSSEAYATATVTYFIDGEEVIIRHPVETWHNGKHVLSLRYDLQASTAPHTWSVHVAMSGGAIEIDRYGIHTVIMGQGLAGEGEWDGVIEAEDSIAGLDFMSMFSGFSDECIVTLYDDDGGIVKEV